MTTSSNFSRLFPNSTRLLALGSIMEVLSAVCATFFLLHPTSADSWCKVLTNRWLGDNIFPVVLFLILQVYLSVRSQIVSSEIRAAIGTF
jgi:hypothetical protein